MKKIILGVLFCFLLIGASLVSGIPKTQNNYISYWNFDEGSGSIVHDSSVNGYDGTIYGANWRSEVISGYALDFDGSDNDYIEINNPNGLKFSDESFTISAWVQIRDNVDDWRCFICLGPQSQNYPSIQLSKTRSGHIDGRIIFKIAQTPTSISRCVSIEDGNSLPKNQWMLVTGVVDYENSQIRLFIDGVLQDVSPLINFNLNSVSNFRVVLGDFTNQNSNVAWQSNHNGLLDEVRIYNHALTQTEIISLMT